MWKKLKNNNKKGFTLVELIVVLVILAILAALLIPALTGYINKAKEKNIIAETRQAVMAAQTLVDEAYAKKKDGSAVTVGDTAGTGIDVTIDQIKTLAEVDGTIKADEVTVSSGTEGKESKVTDLIYYKGGLKCTYDDDSTTDVYAVEAGNP